MFRGKTVTVVMPGRTVAKILENQIKQTPDFVDEIILVSNNSKDNTVELAEELSKVYPKFKYYVDNRVDNTGIGYGYAIQTGFSKATSDFVFKLDADGTYPVDELSEVIDHMLKNDLKMVSCNRYPVKKESKNISLFHKVGVVTLNLTFWLVTGYRIKDVLSGFYGGYTENLKELKCSEGGWNYSVELKLKSIMQNKNSFGEYHIEQREQQAASHQRYFQTGFKHLSYIITSNDSI